MMNIIREIIIFEEINEYLWNVLTLNASVTDLIHLMWIFGLRTGFIRYSTFRDVSYSKE